MAGKRKGAAPLGASGRLLRPYIWYQAELRRGPQPPLGKLQTTCFIQSEASETFKQLVSSNPRPRKPSNNLFHPIRGLGNLQTTCLDISEASGRPPPPPYMYQAKLRRPCAWSVAVCEMSVQHLRGAGTVCKMTVQHLHGLFTVCKMTVQHLHSPFTVCGGTMQHLHSPFTVCGETMQHLHSPFTVCGETMQHLHGLFTVCETIMQPLHSVVAVCETTMQPLHSLVAVCIPVRRLIIRPLPGSSGGRMQFAPTPGTKPNFAAPAGAVRRRPLTLPP